VAHEVRLIVTHGRCPDDGRGFSFDSRTRRVASIENSNSKNKSRSSSRASLVRLDCTGCSTVSDEIYIWPKCNSLIEIAQRNDRRSASLCVCCVVVASDFVSLSLSPFHLGQCVAHRRSCSFHCWFAFRHDRVCLCSSRCVWQVRDVDQWPAKSCQRERFKLGLNVVAESCQCPCGLMSIGDR
jgi:hypothetical protein